MVASSAMARAWLVCLLLGWCAASCSADGSPVDCAGLRGRRAAPASARPSMAALFVGNSYVFVNDLPGWVRRIAETSGEGPTIDVGQSTGAGLGFAEHASGADLRRALASRAWTYVILQEQSARPIVDRASFVAQASELANVVRTSGAQPLLLETWARGAGAAEYAEPWTGGSPDTMQARLLASYESAATASAAPLIPVGEAWRALSRSHPEIALHQPDGSHPTIAGTYLAACVIYRHVTGRDVPASSAAPPEIPPEHVAWIREAATEVARGTSP